MYATSVHGTFLGFLRGLKFGHFFVTFHDRVVLIFAPLPLGYFPLYHKFCRVSYSVGKGFLFEGISTLSFHYKVKCKVRL